MVEYIKRNAAIDACFNGWNNNAHDCAENIRKLPAADVVEEANILKFYYVRSIDEYWIGRRIDNFYYAEYDFKIRQWVWTHSRYLPWGERVVSQTSAWKEHTYPSEPEEIPFEDWLQGFIKKVHPAADVRPVVKAHWIKCNRGAGYKCSVCKARSSYADVLNGNHKFCYKCGAMMEEI